MGQPALPGDCTHWQPPDPGHLHLQQDLVPAHAGSQRVPNPGLLRGTVYKIFETGIFLNSLLGYFRISYRVVQNSLQGYFLTSYRVISEFPTGLFQNSVRPPPPKKGKFTCARIPSIKKITSGKKNTKERGGGGKNMIYQIYYIYTPGTYQI